MNKCSYSHKKHQTIKVDTILGPMTVFNWNKYHTTEDYCTGRDDISRTLYNEGIWEKLETAMVGDILKEGNRNELVVDIGAHIGYYCRMAEQLGYEVLAYEADLQNIELLKINAPKTKVKALWVDEGSPPLTIKQEMLVLKIDIEGLEQAAVNMCRQQFENRQIKYALVEISPIFNDDYPALVTQIENYGYKTTRCSTGEIFDGNYNFKQDNFLFERLT